MPLRMGIDAIAARLVLAETAQQTIDAQYYQVTNDLVSRGFFDALLRAADRGVRVRLLIDDVFTRGRDAGLAGINSHPNFSIRVFNPFKRRSARFIDAITNFRRINRRMHNKSFTVDNSVTVIGGRNIADEYYGAREDLNFGDLDVLGVGPLVDDVSEMFNAFWNHRLAVDLIAFAQMPSDVPAELERVRGLLETSRQEIGNSPYAGAVRQRFLEFVEDDHHPFTWANHALVADTPGKGSTSSSIKLSLRDVLREAHRELFIVSPYFVPRKSGVRAFATLRRRGVAVTIVTNSLASNNQPLVHAGYAPARKPLLECGVRIFEVRSDADVPGAEIAAASDAIATLHTKSFVVDRAKWFIGSFNFDPRSADINTEMGVIIESPKLAEQAEESFRAALTATTYEVKLDERGKLRWHGNDDGRAIVIDREPHTTPAQRVLSRILRILPLRGQL